MTGTDSGASVPTTAALDRLLSEIRARRDEFTRELQLSQPVIDLMKEAGVFRAMVARRFGGEEWTPAQFLRLIERISIEDGSAGWVASFGFSAVYLSALPIGTLEAIYRNGPDVVFAGGIYPPQTAIRVADGVKVSGRWSWGSGSTGAELIGVGIKLEGEAGGTLPLIAVMPRDRVEIVENWNVIGLRGTGSHDMVVKDVIVPDDWVFVRGGGSSLEMPLYRYPTMVLSAQVLAVVGLGVARAALDEIIRIAGGRPSITGAPAMANRPYVQTELARAEAMLRSAKSFFYEMTEESFARISAGETLDRRTLALLRLAASNAARAGAEVARAAYTISGTAGVFADSAIARAHQDAIIVPQHAFLSEGTWQSAGAALLGLDTPPGFP